MSEKSVWGIVVNILRGGGSTTGGTTGSATVCPNGHPMDPSWTSCPRCDAESRARERTTPESSSSGYRPGAGRSSDMSRSNTIISGGASETDSFATRVESSDDFAPRVRSSAPRRKVTGVLVTFTWERHGDLFTLYEGRNFIGKGNVESEGGRPCDVLMQDNTMSNEHAVIICRAGRYQLFDRLATNGTFADGEFVETTGVELRDGAKIKTGETVWLFRKIESDSTGPEPHHHEKTREGPASRDDSTIM